MKKEESAAIHPSEYLREGFLGEDGRVREGVNGYYSLGMAWRLRHEGLGPERVKPLYDGLVKLAEARMPKAAERALGEEDRQELEQAWVSAPGEALGELKAAVVAQVKDWKQYSAALLHVERILKQLALLQAVGQA